VLCSHGCDVCDICNWDVYIEEEQEEEQEGEQEQEEEEFVGYLAMPSLPEVCVVLSWL